MCDSVYCPTHLHSEFSALDGAGTVEEIAAHIESIGMPGAFVTDHGLVAGWEPFAKAMNKRGLFAGRGMEAYQAEVHRYQRPESYYREITNAETGRTQRRLTHPRDAYHLVLLAQNDVGARNLKILTQAANDPKSDYPFPQPRLDWELLEKYNEGLICTSACMAGLVAKGVKGDDTDALNRYLRIFGDRFYIELHAYRTQEQRDLNEALVSIAQERGIPTLAVSDAHYACQEDYFNHETLLTAQMGPPGTSEGYGWKSPVTGAMRHHPPDLWIMDGSSMASALSYLGEDRVAESMANTLNVMELCRDITPMERKLHLPKFTQADEVAREVPNNRALLLELMEEGLVERYGDENGDLPDEVVERAEFEFRAITEAFGKGERGLEDYFLITWDLINWCHRQGILTGPGRGSAAGSILAYSLGITDIDPIKYNLFFERFWNPGRADGLPDIDNDIPQKFRGEAKEYLARRWGHDHVRDIGTHIRMQPKSAIDKALKPVYGEIEYDRATGRPKNLVVGSEYYAAAERIKKLIETLEDAGKQPEWHDVINDDGAVIAEGIYTALKDELAPYIEEYPELFEAAEWLTGRLASYGVHASAVILSDEPLTGLLPGRLVEDKTAGVKKLVTQIEMKEVEALGFLKLDLLGLRNLDTLMEAVALVPELAGRNPNDIFKRDIDWDDQPDEMYELLDLKMTLGLFQIEDGNAARRIAKDMEARSLEDLGAIVALNRPGPLRSGMVDRYFERRSGEAPVRYQHEILEPILNETYGDFLYQESVLAYFRAIGYTLSEADDMRSILGKKKVKQMHAEHPRYLQRAQDAGISEEQAEVIWNEIVDFSKYSFNKSHAISYGKVLLWTMWMKYHYPTEFILASILTAKGTTKRSLTERVGDYVNEGRRMGVTVLGPDINRSGVITSKVDDDILFGLSTVKGVNETAAEWIIANRPFESFEDLLAKLEAQNKAHLKLPAAERPEKSPKQLCSRGALNALLNAGAFDGLYEGEYWYCEKQDVPQVRDPSKTVKKDVVVQCDKHRRAEFEQELTGIVFQDLYSDILLDNAERVDGCVTVGDVQLAETGERMRCYGVVAEVDKRTLKEGGYNAGEQWARVTVEWNGSRIQAAAWPGVWKANKSHLLKPGVLGLFDIEVKDRGLTLAGGERLT